MATATAVRAVPHGWRAAAPGLSSWRRRDPQPRGVPAGRILSCSRATTVGASSSNRRMPAHRMAFTTAPTNRGCFGHPSGAKVATRGSVAAMAGDVPVVELVLLLQVKEGADPETVQEMVDWLYTLQYYTGQITCVNAGEAFGGGGGGGAFTHGFHARFPTEAALEGFYAHPQYGEVMEKFVGALCKRTASASFTGAVDNDMFGVFMRGDEWDAGVQRLALVSGGEGADVDGLVAALGGVPVPLMQLTAGRAAAAAAGGGGSASSPPSHALMARADSKMHLRALSGTPQWEALVAAEGVEVELVDFTVGEVQGSESSSARSLLM